MTDLNQQSLEATMLEIRKIMEWQTMRKHPTKIVVRPVDIQAVADRHGVSFDEALALLKSIAKDGQ
jgi:hypothetical protein